MAGDLREGARGAYRCRKAMVAPMERQDCPGSPEGPPAGDRSCRQSLGKEGSPVPSTRDTYDWNDEAVSRLRSFWSEGHSAAEIGRRLGISKSAVIGKAHRLDLPARPSPVRQASQTGARPQQQRAPVPKLAEIMSVRLAASLPGTLDTVARPEATPSQPAPAGRGTGTSRPCCWPIGHPGTANFRFCGNPAAAAKPYCAEHASIAYRPLVHRDTSTPASALAD